MKKKVLAAALTAVLLLSACSQTSPASVSEAEQTTTTTEATTASTTEATTESTTEATTVATYSDDMLPMSIDEVVETITKATGYSKVPEKEMPYNEKNKQLGIVDSKSIIYFGDTIYIEIHLVEFDMESDQYKTLKDGGEFEYYFPSGDNAAKLQIAAINKQYVTCIAAMPVTDGSVSGDGWEIRPPYTMGKAQEAYDTFVSLGK